jgi:hypothetical protein
LGGKEIGKEIVIFQKWGEELIFFISVKKLVKKIKIAYMPLLKRVFNPFIAAAKKY